jgi:O-antigen/teichoic acid export membrane protein
VQVPSADTVAAPVRDRAQQPPGKRSIWRRVRHDFAVLGAGSLGIMVAQLAFRSILIVVLVPAEYGRLSLVLSIYNTVMLIGVSGLPNTASRYIAIHDAASDGPIVRGTLLAALGPTIAASLAVGICSGVILGSALAGVFGVIGLAGMALSLVAMGILRGRGRIYSAAAILPAAAAAEVLLLAAAWKSGLGFDVVSAFGYFCFGNVVSAGLAAFFLFRTRVRVDRRVDAEDDIAVPSARELLGFSVWLTLASIGVAAMPLVMRFAAAFDSYTVVAMVDVALVLLSVPQRIGTVIVSAVVPHASRDAVGGEIGLTISRREHVYLIIPFVLLAALVAFTPLIETIFNALGRPAYASAGIYLSLALLASPARILYGLVQGVLTGHGEGRFLAFNALGTTIASSALIFALGAMGSIIAAFAVFVAACWIVYLGGLLRIHRLSSSRVPLAAAASQA